MAKVGFITCADLSKYKLSKKNSYLTHDDQLACDFLQEKNFIVEPVLWGSDINYIKNNFNILIIRSPWDYSISENNTREFFSWLKALREENILLANSYEILLWNLDKHYLRDLDKLKINIVPTEFFEPHEDNNKIYEYLQNWQKIVVKPCVSAGARNTYLINNTQELDNFILKFNNLRNKNSYMIQPFIQEICHDGEWSLIFLNQEYSHAVLKKPKAGNWLVQDELGGFVFCLEAPTQVRVLAQDIINKINYIFPDNLLYGRIDILPGLLLGELELFEPELFFLDRRNMSPNIQALTKFYQGIIKILAQQN